MTPGTAYSSSAVARLCVWSSTFLFLLLCSFGFFFLHARCDATRTLKNVMNMGRLRDRTTLVSNVGEQRHHEVLQDLLHVALSGLR